jgi:UrcA family protein
LAEAFGRHVEAERRAAARPANPKLRRGAPTLFHPQAKDLAPQPLCKTEDQTMYRTLSAIAAAALTVGTFALAAPAQAAPADDGVTVTLGGLNPADPADSTRIERRIRNAAHDLCGSQAIQPLQLMQKAAACEKAVVADAQNAVELAAARQGGPFRLTLRSN